MQSTVIPETLEHAEAPLSSIESLHHQDAGSESPKSEFPEPGSALQDLAPSKLVTPGAASAVASSRRHTNVQAVINGDDDRDAAVGEKTPCSRKRARQDSERPNGVVHPETPNQALAAQAGRKARLSNPRSLSKSSRAKAELRRAAKDLFAVPSDIDSTQEGPLSAQRRGINQGPVRRLNGSKFKPFPREKADQSNVERPPKSVRANGVEHVMSHRAQIAVEQQVPVPLSTPQRVAESDQRKTPHPPAAVVSAQPDQPGQTRRTPQEESPNNVASAAPASASAVNADSRATGSPSNKKSVGEDESEDVEMHDAPTGDESDTSGGSDATDPLRTGAEPKASIPKSKREPPRDPGSVDETSDNSDESPAPSAKSTKKANNGINHTNSTASLPCDVSNCEAEKVTEKTLEPLGESGSEKVTSESEGSQEVSDEVEKTREVAQVPQKKSVSKPPRLVKRVKDVRRASSSKERGRTESVTGPLPSPSRSPSRSSLAEGSASPSLQAATSEAGPNKAKKPSLRQALSNRRSVSFMEDSGARNSPLPAQIGRVRASDDSAQPKARASPAEPKAPASRRSSSTSINPFKTVQSAGRKSFYADLFQTFRKSLKPETNNETDKAVKTAAPVTKGKGAARSSKQGTPETKEKEKPKAVKSAESTAPNPPGKRTKTIAKKSLPKSSSDEGSDEKPPARTSKERTVNGTAKASTGRTNSNLTRRRPSAAEKPAANVRRARESTTTTDSAITDVKSVKNVEAKNRSLTQPTSVSREHSPSAVEVSSSADSKTQGTGLRDSTRSRSPAKAVESSLESDAGEDDNSSSNGDLRKPSREEAATDANATIPNQNSETDEEDDEESANEEEIETQLPPGHASLPGHQSAALPNDRSRDVKASRHDKSAKQDDETSSSGPTESSDASDDGAEDETSGHASINHESSVKESESGSSEPDDESTSVAEKTTLLDDVRSPVTQIGEEDGAAKQLHMEASECAMQSSPVSKTPALLYSSSQFAAKALSSNANPNSSFGRTPTFTELKKQSFVAAPVPHANLRNRAYKMPLNRQPPTKRTSVEGSSDSSEYESSEDGGMEDLVRSMAISILVEGRS